METHLFRNRGKENWGKCLNTFCFTKMLLLSPCPRYRWQIFAPLLAYVVMQVVLAIYLTLTHPRMCLDPGSHFSSGVLFHSSSTCSCFSCRHLYLNFLCELTSPRKCSYLSGLNSCPSSTSFSSSNRYFIQHL